MKRRILYAAILGAAISVPVYAVDWEAVEQNVAAAPTVSNVEADKTAAEQRASTYDTTTYTTDTQIAANTNSSDALSEQVTSADWLKNLLDNLASHSNQISVLQAWTGAGGFASAMDLHDSLQGQINVVDNDLQGYKVSTNNTLSQHDTALKAISSYNGSAASAASAKVDNIASGAVGNTQIATNAVTSSKIMDGQVGTLDLADGAATSSKIANNAITSSKIMDGQVGASDLANGAVTSSKIANNAVTSSKIMDGQVGRADLAANSVDSSKVINNSLTGADIANGSITGTDIANGSITGTDIANGTITSNDLSSGATGGGIKGEGSSGLWSAYEGTTISCSNSHSIHWARVIGGQIQVRLKLGITDTGWVNTTDVKDDFRDTIGSSKAELGDGLYGSYTDNGTYPTRRSSCFAPWPK